MTDTRRLRALGSTTRLVRAWQLRYALAFVAVGLAWASRERLLAEAGGQSPFLAFGLAVLITALAAGFGPGLLAMVLSSVVAVYFYLPPQLALAVHEPSDGVQLGLFALEGLAAAIAGGLVRWVVDREKAVDRVTRRLARFMERAEVVRGQPLVNPERLIEDLTEREREVARLLAFGLGNGEIAATLFVSRNTVKTHLKHIYEKLAVRTRTEAVARCIELGLLRGPPGDDEQRAVLVVDSSKRGGDPRFRQPDASRIVRTSPAGGGDWLQDRRRGPTVQVAPAWTESPKWVTRRNGAPSTFEPSGRRATSHPSRALTRTDRLAARRGQPVRRPARGHGGRPQLIPEDDG